MSCSDLCSWVGWELEHEHKPLCLLWNDLFACPWKEPIPTPFGQENIYSHGRLQKVAKLPSCSRSNTSSAATALCSTQGLLAGRPTNKSQDTAYAGASLDSTISSISTLPTSVSSHRESLEQGTASSRLPVPTITTDPQPLCGEGKHRHGREVGFTEKESSVVQQATAQLCATKPQCRIRPLQAGSGPWPIGNQPLV